MDDTMESSIDNSLMDIKDILKGMTKNEHMSTCLKSFVKQAESFNAESSKVDIVKQYLQLSGNASEILELTKRISTSDIETAVVIMKALCQILIRVANDLSAFISVGTSIANEVLSSCMRTVINFLKVNQKTTRTKLVLHLLTCMAALGEQMVHQIVSKLDFSNIIFTQLLARRNFSDEEDIRTEFINFIILIMTMGDLIVIRKLAEVKGLLNDILSGLTYDRFQVVIQVLSAFQKLIVENTGIPKTIKHKLFNDHSLKPVIKLYSWKGPLKQNKSKKRKLGEKDQPVNYEASEEEIQEVQTKAHEFMLSLCCTFKNGIIYHDTSVGYSGKNVNQVLTNILAFMPKPHTNALVADFVISVLKVCPDQIVHYMPLLKSSCAPRLSSQWFDAISIVKKIILAQDPKSILFDCGEKKPVSCLIQIAKSICFPCVVSPSDFEKAFKEGKPFVCYHLCDYLICMLDKINAVSSECIQANNSKGLYSAADLSAFNHSFLTSVLLNFTFMKDIEEFWEKLASLYTSMPEGKDDIDVSPPSLFNLLMKILEVMRLFLNAFHHCYHEHEVNVPKLFRSLKNCYSFLSHEEICKLNVKIVDVISAQEEEAVMLWNKSLIDSPLIVLLDVYLTDSSEHMIEDVSQILHKVLVHTKVFDFCPWETNVWLQSMKSSKPKYFAFTIQFISDIMCCLLQNPNMFSDDIIDTTFGKSNLNVILDDVTSMLNNLFSTDQDPIVIENFEESSSLSSVPRLCFSSLVPAALYSLNSVHDHKRKACQSFVEKALYHIMHHQHSPEALFGLVQKYKNNISSSLFHYFELLCQEKYEPKEFLENNSVACKDDICEHLKSSFVTLHTLQNPAEGCHCDIQLELQQLSYSTLENVVWQLLTYIEWEINLLLKEKIQNNNILNYLNLIEKILSFLNETSMEHEEIIRVSELNEVKNVKHKIFEEILSRPSILNFYLWADGVPKSKKTIVKNFITNATSIVLSIIASASPHDNLHNNLVLFKEKVVKFISYYFETVNSQRIILSKDVDICYVISCFSTVFSSSDVASMFEDLLNLEKQDIKSEEYFSALSLIFKMYIELKDFILLSPNAVSSMFIKFTEMSKKQMKITREYIIQLFQKHPTFASAVSSDSCHLLLKHPASKNFYILGCLIDCNINLRQSIQSSIVENIEEFKNTPDFIYLVSKCILKSDLNEDTNFLETVAQLFWERICDHILTDIAAPDMLLQSCDAGKAIQVLFNQNLLAIKKMSKFFKAHTDKLTSAIPSSSNMIIFLQFMEVLKNQPESKSIQLVLKLAVHWLTSVVSSFKNVSEFGYFPLIHFTLNLLQNTSEVNMTDLVQNESFFQKLLKVALKYKEIGVELIEILSALCQKSKSFNEPVQLIFNLVTGHSNFFSIMLSQIKENENWKECIVDLLIILVSRDKEVCKDNHLGLILSSYTGTLKSVDRKLLYLIKLYSESNVDMIKFSPFLWGKTAVVHYAVMNAGSMALWKKPKLQDLLSIISLDMLETTIEKYPLNLKLEPSIDDSCEEIKSNPDLDKIYDLRFFLPLFANVLSPGSFVHCRNFMDSRVLILFIVSLSSFDKNTRALGYYCLSQLYFHLEGANYGEKEIWLSLLDSLRNSITETNPRIPSIVSLFIARVVIIFTKPDHPLFSALYKFIMVKPVLDISQVPEFYVLFNSLDIEHRVQRMWILKLLADGLRSNLDFHICEKRHIFSLILSHYWSSVSSPEEKSAILDILSAAVKIDTCSKIFCQKSLLSWMHSVIKAVDSTDVAVLQSLCCLLKNFWFSCKETCQVISDDKDDKIKSVYLSVHNEFPVVALDLFKKAIILDTRFMKLYLLTLHDILSFLRNSEVGDRTFCNLLVNHIYNILQWWQSVSEKEIQKKLCSQNSTSCSTSDSKEISELVTKIILLWSPCEKECNEEYCASQNLCILESVQLMLQPQNTHFIYLSDLPKWLYKCLKKDKSHELVKLFLSSRGESCLKLILEFYEKSLRFQECTIDAKHSLQLCSETKENASHLWRKILSYFKKVCKNCKLTPNHNLYQQITVIL